MTTRRNFLVGMGALALPVAALGQQTGKVWRVGVLYQSTRQSFMELVQLKPDLIVATSTPPAVAVKQATATISIVIVGVADPVGSGLAASLARPGGNLTGLTNLHRELAAKQVDLLIDLIPKIGRIAVMRNPHNASSPLLLKAAESAARARGLQLHLVDVVDPGELESAFAGMGKSKVSGLVVLPDALYQGARQRMAELAIKNRVPTVFARGYHADAGALVAYGPSFTDDYVRVGRYVNRIFKGARPAELPIEQPTRFELVVNMKTARALGLTIPQTILVRADRVIE